MNSIPRAEHPRPDRERAEWLSLNGTWEFEIDNARVGVEKRFFERTSLEGSILVPFCPESRLSGVAHTDFMNTVWYRRDIEIPPSFAGKRVLLHVDACDYHTAVYVNGQHVGSHDGGYTPFAFDITDALQDGKNSLTVRADDDLRLEKQPSGKQSSRLASYGCYYTRTTGIWQSVWLEAVEEAHVLSYRAYPNVTDPSVGLLVSMSQASLGATLTVKAYYEGRLMGKSSIRVDSLQAFLTLPLAEKHLWECGKGRLYDLVFTTEQNGRTDLLKGYFGLREVALTKEKGFTVNGKTVFGRFVLDQGFYPEGIYTAPSDEALLFDIEASMACGFNGARLHQKVFEPRFLYHADRLGYLVWAETGNWGLDHTEESSLYSFLPEWLEEIERDFSHPSVIGWCPFNETWDKHGRRQCKPFLDTVYDVTRAIDRTRPVITSSGSYPSRRTDVHDVHDYEQDPEKLRSYYADLKDGVCRDQLWRRDPHRQVFDPRLPVFVSEYGGIAWVMKKENGAWGYGKSVTSEEEFFARLEGLTDALLESPFIFAFCYTQLTDVEQEQNGLLTYQREYKFAPERYHRIFSKVAAIEK